MIQLRQDATIRALAFSASISLRPALPSHFLPITSTHQFVSPSYSNGERFQDVHRKCITTHEVLNLDADVYRTLRAISPVPERSWLERKIAAWAGRA